MSTEGLSSEGYFVIWSIEHGQWWGCDGMGYTRYLSQAGIYAAPDAARIVEQANRVAVNECAIPLACVAGSVLTRHAAALERERGQRGKG